MAWLLARAPCCGEADIFVLLFDVIYVAFGVLMFLFGVGWGRTLQGMSVHTV